MPQFRRWGVAEQGFWRGWFTLPRVVTEGADKLPRFQPHPQLETLQQKGNSVGPEGTDRTMDAAGCGRDGVGDSA